MVLEILLFVSGGIVLLTIGAEGIVKGSAGLAEKIGISRLVIGLTIVAFGTSSPELMVSVTAAMTGNSAIALGNVIGSNIANIALIAGLSALIHPLSISKDVVRLQIPFLIVISTLLCLVFIDGDLQFYEGLVFLVIFLFFLAYTIRMSRNVFNNSDANRVQKKEQDERGMITRLPVLIGLIVIGLLFLTAGADLFVKGAILCSEILGVSQGTVGLTIVALGTSLPELATSTVAAFKGESDIAIGNIVGSNVFNILSILGITALIQPIPQTGIATTDFLFMLGTAVLLLPLSKSGFIVDRREGMLLLVIYVGYLFFAYAH